MSSVAYRSIIWMVALYVLSSTLTCGTARCEEEEVCGRPRIGLALSGGGARGAAHIGVIKVLEEYLIPIDYIAGTSMGALIGGLYSSGMRPDELESLISHIDWKAAFSDMIPRKDRSFRRKRDDDLYLVKHKPGFSGGSIRFPPGIIDGQQVDLLLKKYTLPVVSVRDFDDLNIPYRAVATDIVTGETVVLDHGDLALAMRASMSLPAIFAPREIEGRLLVDGGVSCNLPIDVLRNMGAEVIIAVDIGTQLQGREELTSVLSITGQITNILTRRDADSQILSLTGKDVLIRPDLGDITTASFDRAWEAVPIGAGAANDACAELELLSVTPEEYRRRMRNRVQRLRPPVICEVRIVNQSRLGNGVIASMIDVPIGEQLDVTHLERDIARIYGLKLFESVYYDITGETGECSVLTITAREASWGPNYLQFGVAVLEDFESPNFNLAASYTRSAVNRLNGEWRTHLQIGREPGVFSGFHQPLDNNLRYFTHLHGSFIEQADNLFDEEGNNLTELGVRRYGFGIAAGRELGTWGEVRTGLVRETGEVKVHVGDPEQPDLDFDAGEVFIQVFVDELDNVNFPRSGGDLRIRLSSARKELGSDGEYEQGVVEGSYALSRGRYTGLLGGLFASTRDSDALYPNLFRLGGFTRLSGLQRDELSSQHAVLLKGCFFRRLGDFKVLSFFGGLSFEYGNVFRERGHIGLESGIAAGSAFLGLDTIIGPAFIAYGLAEGGRGNFYFILGRSFNGHHTSFGK